MRSVDKGPAPQPDYNPYQTAKRDLVAAIGDYCSYCERKIEHMGAVEHVQPKSAIPALATKWDNFLLGCVNCNSTKGSKVIDDTNIVDYVFPDKDDTFALIEYDPVTCLPRPAVGLSDEMTAKVENLIALVGLDKPQAHVGTLEYMKMSDVRAEKRLSASQQAERYKQTFLAVSPEQKEVTLSLIMDIVKGVGFWSQWMRVMKDVPELAEALWSVLPGTKRKAPAYS